MLAEEELDYTPYEMTNPEKLSVAFRDFDRPDKRFNRVAVGVIAVLWTRYSLAYALLGIAAWALLMWRLQEGRVYYVPWWQMRSLYITKVRKNLLWKPGMRKVIPLAVTDVDMYSTLYNWESNTDTIYIESPGSTTASRGIAGQFQANRQIAEVLKKVAGISRVNTTISMIFSRGPENMAEIKEEFQHHHPEVYDPKRFLPEDEWETPEGKGTFLLYENSIQVEDLAEAYGGTVSCVLAINVQRPPEFAKHVRRRNVDAGEAKRLLLAKLAKAACKGLAYAGVQDPAVMQRRRLQQFIREGWDITHDSVNEYHQLLADEERTGERLLGPGDHWPKESIMVWDDHVVFDGTNHFATLVITEQPPRTLPNYLRQLFALDVPMLKVTTIGETISSRRDEKSLNRIIPFMGHLEDLMGVEHKSSRQRAREEEFAAREEDIFNSRFVQGYVILVTVGDTTLEGLREHIETVTDTVNGLSMSSTVVRYACRQHKVLLSAATGVPML